MIEDVDANGQGVREVGIEIVLFSVYRQDGERWYIEESDCRTSGPCNVDMPLRLLNKLTPTSSEWAQEWRAQVVDYHKRRRVARTQIGSQIELTNPVGYGRIGGNLAGSRGVDDVVARRGQPGRVAATEGLVPAGLHRHRRQGGMTPAP